MSYDGTTALQPVIAELLGISPKSQEQIARATKEAKIALSIDLKVRRLSPEDRLRVYEYLKGGQLDKADTSSEPKPKQIPEPGQQKTSVEINSQTVESISHPTDNIVSQDVEIKSQIDMDLISQPVEIVTQLLEVTLKNNVITGVSVKHNHVKTNSHNSNLISQANNFDDVRIAFYVTDHKERKRQVISLDGFFINALCSIGISKQEVPQWLQAQVDGWTAFDSHLPKTRQVKYLIMREVVKGLSGSDAVFYDAS
ncbi:hypothetical protein AU255_02190 [Methyloprofundus sedimenti]|uniref:Uncharacterized protein n=1 Tax=Methyloprofundus sedimenti TaxID=1420851 RepID=A0A1V8M5B8_9GAMM|nr:hypothetical protein [Methyloprofundus sedimenti]OQK16739.1 hypothetical protein AU255_02190 [Methyloprofundus sedimenti]